MNRRILAAGLILVAPAFALAQDEKALSGNVKDDIAFADQLVEKNYPDLAEKLLTQLEKKGGGGAEAMAAMKKVRLNVAQEVASKIEDPIKKKDELRKVLTDKEKFIGESKATMAAEDVRRTLPDLYELIGQTISAAIRKEKDEKVLASLRSEADQLFGTAETNAKARLAELKEVERPEGSEEEAAYQAAYYNYCRTLLFHAQVFALGSPRRNELLNHAIDEYGEFDLEVTDTIYNLYAYVDVGLAFKDLGKTKDAVSSFDVAIKSRELWEPDKKGVYPVDASIANLVCYATLTKVNLLRETKELAEAVKVAREYFATILDPWEAQQALALAITIADSQIDIGDLKGALATADEIAKVDPRGYHGYIAGTIRERAGGGSYSDRLKAAAVKLDARDYDGGISLCRLVVSDTAGTDDATEAGCDAMVLMGNGYFSRGWYDDAALCFQTAADRYPKAKGAAEAIARLIDSLSSANGKAKRKYYKDKVEEATNRLVRDYPNDPRVADIVMLKARALEGEGDFLGAIELYKQVKPTSTNYTKAMLMIGINYFNHAQKLASDKATAGEAPGFYPQAEAGFKKAIETIAAQKTLDETVLKAYDTQSYLATLSLAKLYMIPAFNRIADAGPAIDTLEKRWSKDHGPEIQDLRGRLYLSQGLYEAAEKWVDDLVKRDPIAAAGPAGRLARALDEQGAAKRKEKPDSNEGDDLWKRALRFYYISLKPQIDGKVAQNADEMMDVGNRMMSYGAHFNGLPEAKQNFVDWVPGTKKWDEPFARAVEIYRAALEQNPDFRNSINLGRAYGFLKRWKEGAEVYAKLFEQEPVLNAKDKRKLDPAILKVKPQLAWAYCEWGVCERMAFREDNDKDRLVRCLNAIFSPLSFTVKSDVQPDLYWATMYHLVMTLMDRGDYNDASLSLKNTKREVSPTFDDDKFGYKTRFEAVEAELAIKLPGK